MKLYLVAAGAAVFLPSDAFGYTGGVYSFRRPSPPCSPSGARKQRQRVDRAFQELASEFGAGGRGGCSPQSNEKARRQQQEWINRAFGLASEVASELSSPQQVVKETNEALRQQQEWANRAFNIANDVASGFSSPRYTIKNDDEEKFQVELDVPGVRASAIDIRVEDDGNILTIQGEREVGQGDSISRTAKFSKTFSLDPNLDTEQITAKLTNGVLCVSAPKVQVETKSKKIPVVQTTEQDAVVGFDEEKSGDAVMNSSDDQETDDSKEIKDIDEDGVDE